MKEKIVCAAIYYNDGKKRVHQPINIETGIVICGLMHCNCFSVLSELSDVELKKTKQGFLTTKNRFVDRIEAATIAFREKQIKKETSCLFSEDFY
jgi:hypothetical protein